MALCDYIEYQAQLEEDFYDWLNGEGFKKDYQEAVESLAGSEPGSDIDPGTEILQILL